MTPREQREHLFAIREQDAPSPYRLIRDTPSVPASEVKMRPLPARYYETKLAVESVLHNLDTAVFQSPHEDGATESDLARMVNGLAKLRLALQEVAR